MKTKLLQVSLVILLMMLFNVSTYSQSIIGKWKTIDDDTGKTESIVEIWKAKDGKFYGKIIKLYDEDSANRRCTECDKSDSRYNKKIMGMTIITKMKKTGDNEWTGGKILDPKNGKEYTCKLFREGKNLMVRGYIAFLYRTQKWLPVD